MDIAPPPKAAGSSASSENGAPRAAPAHASTNAAIPTTTTSAMPVKEAPHEPGSLQSQADAPGEPAPEASTSLAEVPKATPKPARQSMVGIVVATITVMIALASLTIVVYLNS